MARRSPVQPQPSARLIQILRIYCHHLDPISVGDLRIALLQGRYPWLREELEAIMTSRHAGTGWWSDAIGTPHPSAGDAAARVADEQGRLWQALFPDQPAPHPRSRPGRRPARP
ncbi:hypothetical protein Cci01nite_81340 [Catellatospora citrea]|uniref:Uncharacterized protein n=1 Tax=Catellatospora citrea TaxID=53366 RepID=A0A8J3P642_9ACTN|nr:hypothetical protein Cci01nite_81340 [Catellatospora citrea]